MSTNLKIEISRGEMGKRKKNHKIGIPIWSRLNVVEIVCFCSSKKNVKKKCLSEFLGDFEMLKNKCLYFARISSS